MKKFLVFTFLLITCCAKENSKREFGEEAMHFSIESKDGHKILNVKEAWNGDSETHKWVFPDSLLPLKRVVVLSTTAIAFMERLGLLDRIIAVENRNLIYSQRMQHLIDSLNIKQVGSGNSLDLETLLILQPDAVITFGSGSSVYDDYPRLKTAGIPALLTAEWMESHPLARFEWIKFFGVLFGKENEADSIFKETVQKYNLLAQQALNSAKHPVVLTGYPQGSEWLAGGGNSYFAKFLQDAGAKYIWENNEQTGVLTLNIETALQSGIKAEYWLHPSLWTSKKEIMQNEPRMTMLPLWQSGKIYQNSKRRGKNGSRDFYESAVAYPDLVLADLICIFNSAACEFVYYETVE